MVNTTKEIIETINLNLTEEEFVAKMREIYLEKRLNIFPTTFEECCKILQCKTTLWNGGYMEEELVKIQVLFILRNAYWVVANWQPDWSKTEIRYAIINGEVVPTIDKHFLVFPTEEIALKFLHLFGDDIHDCKDFFIK
jgi:hypothetical protein